MADSRQIIPFRVLGILAVGTPGSDAAKISARARQVALLSYLAIATPRGFHKRDSLLPLLWPAAERLNAWSSFRQAVDQMRQALGEDAILSRGDQEFALNPDRVRCDAARFTELVRFGANAEAIAWYGGPLLPGFYVDGAPDFERWLERERASIQEQAAVAAWTLSENAERSGNREGAATWAREAFAFDPFSEPMLRRLMETLARSGDRAGAGRAYDEYAARLRSVRGQEPSATARAFAAAVRMATPTESLRAMERPSI